MRYAVLRMVRQFCTSSRAYHARMSQTYENAVRTLNGLQSNAKSIEQSRLELQDKTPMDQKSVKEQNLAQMVTYLQRSGFQLDDLDKLSIIHVSGTKGKGSTCAYCESILRTMGYTTGFFSSPHLIEVRERFRINGQIMSKDMFSDYFWNCYNALDRSKDENNGKMPAYFRFLTIMAFHVFLREKVDVAIMEVGIGGQYDSTNIIRSPVVCGVSSLGIDHTSILGDTIEKIAWNKGGIFKLGTPAVTVPQPGNSLDVLVDRAKERKCNLHMTPDLKDYGWRGHNIELGIAGDAQVLNASLALQLCKLWNQYKDKPRHSQVATGEDIEDAEPFQLSEAYIKGLKDCWWPGRNQLIRRKGVSYYLDGAHTPRSIQQCINWFNKRSEQERKTVSGKVVKVLLFNSTGDRKSSTLLEPLVNCNFDCAVFCPNLTLVKPTNDDQSNLMVSRESQVTRCFQNRNAWQLLIHHYNELNHDHASHRLAPFDMEVLGRTPRKRKYDDNDWNSNNNKLKKDSSDTDVKVNGSHTTNGVTSSNEDVPNNCNKMVIGHANIENESCELAHSKAPVLTFPCISQALKWTTQSRDSCIPEPMAQLPPIPKSLLDADHIQILITGSLHLVGGVLKIIDPDLKGDRS